MPTTDELHALCRDLPLFSSFAREGDRWVLRRESLERCLAFVRGHGSSNSGSCHRRRPASRNCSPLSTPATSPRGAAPSPFELPGTDVPMCGNPSACVGKDAAVRWLAEQEYVVGAALLTCCPGAAVVLQAKITHVRERRAARRSRSRSSSLDTAGIAPAVADAPPPHDFANHPMICAALYIVTMFPQWGDAGSFADRWVSQARLITAVASPSSQMVTRLMDGVAFSSAMECGNLARVERRVVHGSVIYLLYTQGDAQTDKRVWFRFSVSGFPVTQALCFRIMNLQPNAKLYRNGMRPVWMCPPQQPSWRLVNEVSFVVTNDDSGQLSFYVLPPPGIGPNDEVHVAFTVPYGYADLLRHITQWHSVVRHGARNIRFEERVLCHTPDERKLHLLIITSQTELAPAKRAVNGGASRSPRSLRVQDMAAEGKSGAVPFSSFANGKRVVLVSGRVHPGEVTASHALHGFIAFLLSTDPRAAKLREHFTFFIVPMLNPDGVARGHTRLDQNGQNLNRFYAKPTLRDQPTVYALKNVYEHLQTSFGDRFSFYLDFHSHASQRKAFVYGNCLPASSQVWNMLFAKLVGVHSPAGFQYEQCRFSKGDMASKEGTSRVLFGSGIINSYTVEVAHFSLSGELEPAAVACGDGRKADDDPVADGGESPGALPDMEPSAPEILTDSADIGRACLFALLDYCELTASAALQQAGGLDALIKQTKQTSVPSNVAGRYGSRAK
jgi:hypothetical protein